MWMVITSRGRKQLVLRRGSARPPPRLSPASGSGSSRLPPCRTPCRRRRPWRRCRRRRSGPAVLPPSAIPAGRSWCHLPERMFRSLLRRVARRREDQAPGRARPSRRCRRPRAVWLTGMPRSASAFESRLPARAAGQARRTSGWAAARPARAGTPCARASGRGCRTARGCAPHRRGRRRAHRTPSLDALQPRSSRPIASATRW